MRQAIDINQLIWFGLTFYQKYFLGGKTDSKHNFLWPGVPPGLPTYLPACLPTYCTYQYLPTDPPTTYLPTVTGAWGGGFNFYSPFKQNISLGRELNLQFSTQCGEYSLPSAGREWRFKIPYNCSKQHNTVNTPVISEYYRVFQDLNTTNNNYELGLIQSPFFQGLGLIQPTPPFNSWYLI